MDMSHIEPQDKSMRASGIVGSKTVRESLYDILNVTASASKADIRESYIRLKNAFGGQSQALYSLMSDEQAQATLSKIEEAFRILNDDARRQIYDREAGFVETPTTPTPHYESKAENTARVDRVQSVPVNLTASTASKDDVREALLKIVADSDASDGDMYRRLREAAGVSEKEMRERTKVGAEYLQAMETNGFERLPQAVFVKGFLRSYLKYLGIGDVERLADAYAERLREWQTRSKT